MISILLYTKKNIYVRIKKTLDLFLKFFYNLHSTLVNLHTTYRKPQQIQLNVVVFSLLSSLVWLLVGGGCCCYYKNLLIFYHIFCTLGLRIPFFCSEFLSRQHAMQIKCTNLVWLRKTHAIFLHALGKEECVCMAYLW